MKGTKYHFLVILASLNLSVVSQTNTGSPFSLNELGEINFTGNVSYQSMGGIDSSIDSIEFNINNPSSLAKLKSTNYLIGTFYKSSSLSSNNLKETIKTSNINYFGPS